MTPSIDFEVPIIAGQAKGQRQQPEAAEAQSSIMPEDMQENRAWVSKHIDFFGEMIPIHLPRELGLEELESWTPFQNWKTTLRQNLELQSSPAHSFFAHPYSLREIEIQSVDRFGPRIGFVKLKAAILRDELPGDDKGADCTSSRQQPSLALPGISFLRGASVAILMILRPRDSRRERYVVLTEQPRIPAGSLAFLEIPAGMLDDGEGGSFFVGPAAAEVEEETGFRIPRGELVDMTALALAGSEHPEAQGLDRAMYPSPGGCDESIALLLWEKELDRQEIEDLRGKLAGQRRQSEMITLRVKPYEDLWKEGARDAKTLAAWALYEGLNRSDILEKHLRERAQKEWFHRIEAEQQNEVRMEGGAANAISV